MVADCCFSMLKHSIAQHDLGLQATAEVVLQEAVADLMDAAHALQEEYQRLHDVHGQQEEVTCQGLTFLLVSLVSRQGLAFLLVLLRPHSQPGFNSYVMVQSKEAKVVKDKANQACLIAARSSAELGKLHASQGQPCFAQEA